MSTSLAAVVIGNEVLTAKVVEANGSHLLKRARERQLPVVSVHVVPDEVDAIVEAVMLARRRATVVVTSGGVGPTHDDVTVRAVALALGRPIERVPTLEAMVREAWRDEVPDAAFRMAEAPVGSVLHPCPETRFPVVACDGVYMLPGVPALFRLQLEVVLTLYPGRAMELGTLYLAAHEADIARALDSVALSMPDVAFGSYPTFDGAQDWTIKLTVEHPERARIAEALERLRAALPAEAIVQG